MNRFPSLLFPLLVASCFSGCETPKSGHASEVAPGRSVRPAHDIRNLRTTLEGRSMERVLRLLGRPTSVFTLDADEIWTYEDSARDSITGRDVRWLEIKFSKRIVRDVTFGF